MRLAFVHCGLVVPTNHHLFRLIRCNFFRRISLLRSICSCCLRRLIVALVARDIGKLLVAYNDVPHRKNFNYATHRISYVHIVNVTVGFVRSDVDVIDGIGPLVRIFFSNI